jgi:hypothetical protein
MAVTVKINVFWYGTLCSLVCVDDSEEFAVHTFSAHEWV